MNSDTPDGVQSGDKQRVLVNVILDKSGSMHSKVQDVIGGFNAYVVELAKEPAVDYRFSLTLFDTIVDLKYNAVPLAEVANLDNTTYRPNGNTALLDAIGNTVQTINPEGFDKIITVIMTDGEENSSREWKLDAIRELIGSKEAARNWTFVFLGANLDAFTQGASLGVSRANSARYDSSNYRGVYASLARSTNRFSSDVGKTGDSFFKGEDEGMIQQDEKCRTEANGNHGIAASNRKKPGEGKDVRVEANLVGTSYWRRAEAAFAIAIEDEKDPKRQLEMVRRFGQLAGQLNDLSSEERERVVLEEIENWKKRT